MGATLARAAELAVSPLSAVSQDMALQRSSLAHAGHRPWALPGRPWMLAQTWHDLLFAHWRVAEDDLRCVVPPQLPIDVLDGSAWIGVTPFVVTGFRMHGTPPVPPISSFPELNVRTYVTVDGKPGIYFLSLDADSRLAVAGARRTHRLPYFRAHMRAGHVGARFDYSSERMSGDGPPAAFRATYDGAGPARPADPNTLAWWLTERYCAYTLDERGTVQRADIHHRPWMLQAGTAEIHQNSMTQPYGIELVGEPLLHLSPRQDTLLWALEPVS